MTSITAHTPPRGRAGDTLVLTGAFASSGNTVTVDGIAATVGAESATSVSVTVPAGIRTDRFIPVEVTNPDDGSTFTRQWWSKATPAELKSYLMPLQQPGPFEDWGAASSDEHARDIEAKDIEALHDLLQYLPLDVFQQPGDMVGQGSAAPQRVTAAAPDATVMLDHGTSGIAQLQRKPAILTWGRRLSDASATLMSANAVGAATSSVGTEQRTPEGGRATILLIYVAVQGGTRELDQVELLKNGSVVYDSGSGLGIAAQGTHRANVFASLGVLAATDRLSVRLTGDGGTSTIDCLAMLAVY